MICGTWIKKLVNIYQESKIYDFDFDYKKENWKQLVEKYEPHFEKDEKF